ncbi:3-deoxy-manno-octulosonate cytidylyltransferase [Neisseriaceae bacterium PsAf]|nr:3-deoxy-manno-octulosonate cytidylyltransferase [Neisseriaceae bacterium PsAf]MCV2503270.1 3-deoxy-manno-octulosonate cytidylyltransferase [Neisseriaceae bacterium]
MVNFNILIPARLESSRLPRKALADILGVPMIVRVANQAKKSEAKQVIVATDSDEIAKTCQQFNLPVIMTSSTHQSGTDRLAEAVQKLNIPDDEIILNIQGDEPLINPELINQLAHRLANCKASMATLAHPIHSQEEYQNPNIVKVVLNKNEEAMYFSRSLIPFVRNDKPELSILRHIGLYAYRAQFLKIYHQLESSLLEQVESLEQLRILWHGYAISVLVTEKIASIGVDTQQDLDKVIELIKTNKELL